MKIIFSCLCKELQTLCWFVTVYVYTPESVTQQDGCTCTSEPGWCCEQNIYYIHTQINFARNIASDDLMAVCLLACFSKWILNKALILPNCTCLTFFTEIYPPKSTRSVRNLTSGLCTHLHSQNLGEHTIWKQPYLNQVKSTGPTSTLP